MKNAIIFHSTDNGPDDFWYPWLKAKLEARGYKVTVPHYPDANHVPINEFLPKVLSGLTIDEETVLIGHSCGGPLILSILEHIEVTIAQAILVSGFSYELPPHAAPNVILQPSYDWAKIKAHCKNFVFINSDNDPWGCDDKQGRLMFDKLGGTQITRHEGHFGSGAKNQPYPEFPLVERLIGAES